MPSNRPRERAMWQRVREAHDRWGQLEPYEQENQVTRIADGMGITRPMARACIEGAPCPTCGSMHVDRAQQASGLDICNDCGGLSRAGRELE